MLSIAPWACDMPLTCFACDGQACLSMHSRAAMLQATFDRHKIYLHKTGCHTAELLAVSVHICHLRKHPDSEDAGIEALTIQTGFCN